MERFEKTGFKFYARTLPLFMIMGVSLVYANDAFLAEQRAGDDRVTPEVIELVKHDAHIPPDEQKLKHQQLAQQQFDEIKKQTLEDNAASDYEIKRKTDNSKLLADERRVYVPKKNVPRSESVALESSMRFNGNVKGSGTATATIEKY